MIYVTTPFRIDKNLFQAYDDFMKLLKPEDYAVFRDHDTMFCSNDWMQVIEDGIEQTKGVLFTGWTNRVNCKWQVKAEYLEDQISEYREMESLRGIRNKPVDRTHEQLFSGFFMVIQKRWWEIIKPEIDVRSGCLGLDNEIHFLTRERGMKLWQLDIYLYHFYRGNKPKDVSHLM